MAEHREGLRPPMTFAVTCPLCGELVDPVAPTTWRRISGWERSAHRAGARAGGGSDIVLREPVGDYAHPECIARAKAGLSAGQEALA